VVPTRGNDRTHCESSDGSCPSIISKASHLTIWWLASSLTGYVNMWQFSLGDTSNHVYTNGSHGPWNRFLRGYFLTRGCTKISHTGHWLNENRISRQRNGIGSISGFVPTCTEKSNGRRLNNIIFSKRFSDDSVDWKQNFLRTFFFKFYSFYFWTALALPGHSVYIRVYAVWRAMGRGMCACRGRLSSQK